MYGIKILFFQVAVLYTESGEPEGAGWFEGIIEGIKQAFSDMVEGIFTRLGGEINRIILEFFQTQLANLYNWLASTTLSFSNTIFSHGFVLSWFSVISLLAKLCFFVGLTLYIANTCVKMSHGKKLLIANDIKTYVLYLAFGWFGVDGAVLMFQQVNKFFIDNLITQHEKSLESIVMSELMGVGDVVVVEILMFIVIIICFVSFLFNIMKRIGYIFALISVIPIYMLSFSKGYSSGFFSWLRMFASCSITFFLQYVMFYLGVNLLIANAFILAIVLFVSVPVVPRVLAQFGSGTTSLGDILSDVGNTAKQGASMATTVATGI